MSKLFNFITTSNAITSYIVKADNLAEAREKFDNCEYESEDITDFQNEELTDIEELGDEN